MRAKSISFPCMSQDFQMFHCAIVHGTPLTTISKFGLSNVSSPVLLEDCTLFLLIFIPEDIPSRIRLCDSIKNSFRVRIAYFEVIGVDPKSCPWLWYSFLAPYASPWSCSCAFSSTCSATSSPRYLFQAERIAQFGFVTYERTNMS